MINLFTSEPDWYLYESESKITQRTKNYWTNKELCGGPINEDLSTPKTNKIETPLLSLIEKT